MRYFRKIQGERIYLSPMNKDDAEIYTKWLNDPEVSVSLGNFAQVISLNSEQKALEEMTEKGQNFAIVSNDDVLLGNISFFNIKDVHRRAEVGLFIGERENRGKGYGAEALRLILDYGFKTLNLHNVTLTVHSDNEAGIACYRKVGFKEIGRQRESVFKDGRYLDLVYMDVLEDSFQTVSNQSSQSGSGRTSSK